MKQNLKQIFFVVSLVLGLNMNAFGENARYPLGTAEVSIPVVSGVRSDLLKNIAPLVQNSIANGYYPGAVILVGHRGHIIYKGVFGNRRLEPDVAPMRFNTIFDLASLTKVVATTPAVMQLIEQGKLALDAPVMKYWPDFRAYGKETITIRELLTHTSGLPADFPNSSSMPNSSYGWRGESAALEQIIKTKPTTTPGTAFNYSDINFVILAYLVERQTKMPFDRYVQTYIFNPLKMNDTHFTPAQNLRDRIAPTAAMRDELRWGEVNDPIAYALDGVTGNAGVFSDAADLALYAQCLLKNGLLVSNGKAKKKSSSYLLGPLTILKMTTPQTPPTVLDIRGLGWDIDSIYSNRGNLFPARSFGHTGWTGTSLWIDPITQTWIIILSSRTHPHPATHNKLIQDRRVIANIVAASLTDVTINHEINTGLGELNRAYNPGNRNLPSENVRVAMAR